MSGDWLERRQAPCSPVMTRLSSARPPGGYEFKIERDIAAIMGGRKKKKITVQKARSRGYVNGDPSNTGGLVNWLAFWKEEEKKGGKKKGEERGGKGGDRPRRNCLLGIKCHFRERVRGVKRLARPRIGKQRHLLHYLFITLREKVSGD